MRLLVRREEPREHCGSLAVVDPTDTQQERPVAETQCGPRRFRLPRLRIGSQPQHDLASGGDTEPVVHEPRLGERLEHLSARRTEHVDEHREADRGLVVRGRMHDRAFAHPADSQHRRFVQIRVEHDEVGGARRDRLDEGRAVRALPPDPVASRCGRNARGVREQRCRPFVEVRSAGVGRRVAVDVYAPLDPLPDRELVRPRTQVARRGREHVDAPAQMLDETLGKLTDRELGAADHFFAVARRHIGDVHRVAVPGSAFRSARSSPRRAPRPEPRTGCRSGATRCPQCGSGSSPRSSKRTRASRRRFPRRSSGSRGSRDTSPSRSGTRSNSKVTTPSPSATGTATSLILVLVPKMWLPSWS